MIVVADSGPLRYLVLIEEIIFSPSYGGIVIPAGVVRELSQLETPELVRSWAKALPAWTTVRTPSTAPIGLPENLGIGECEAIALESAIWSGGDGFGGVDFDGR
jgi:predicted nucleic acid-binding protein